MSKPNFEDAALYPVLDKVLAGERLSRDDGVRLFDTPDLQLVVDPDIRLAWSEGAIGGVRGLPAW